MALPKIIGEATIWPPKKDADGVELTFSKSGLAVATFSAGFQKRVKDPNTDQWETKGSINLRVTAFGALAEHVAQNLNPKDRVDLVVRDVENRAYDRQDGTTGYSLEGILESVGLPREKKPNNYSGGFDSPEPNPWG